MLWLVALGMSAMPAVAKEYLVADQASYKAAVKGAKPSDTIVLKEGEWRDFEILFEGQGKPDQPITLTAQAKGRVFITGASNLRLAGEHLVVSGLVFRDGHTPSEEVVAFRRDSKSLASHSRVTEVVIDNFNQPDRVRQDLWVALHGQFNRVDHSQFVGKTNAGVTLAVIRQAGEPLDNRHRIDHNYFGFRPPLGSNGGETIRIGTSDESLSNSNSVVERNYFEHCDGEVEIVSNKSGGNTFRGNTFFESQGSLVLRHGNDNVVEGNVFFGNGKPHTGGIRVINARQTIRGNYMEGLAGTGFASAFAVMNGVPNSVINRYHQVNAALIENNSIIDVARITLGAGADEERSAAPINSRFERNLIASSQGHDAFVVETDIRGIALVGNVQNAVEKPVLAAGITRQSIKLVRDGNGLLYPTDSALATVGAPRTLKPVTKAETGVDWYAKPTNAGVTLGQGKAHRVASPAELAGALGKAAGGDTLQLDAGDYTVAAPLVIDRPVTFAGADKSTKIRFSSPSLFVLRQGGALRLQGVKISGVDAPKVAGNAVIALDSERAPTHYTVEILDSDFIELNRSPGFAVLALTQGSFAQAIIIRDSSFTDVSGAVIASKTRDEADASYAVERVEISGARFENVERVADVFRGGRDESTFGPRFTMVNSTVAGSGKASDVSVRLSGVLFSTIEGNRFSDSGSIQVTHGVGAPQTVIVDNKFVKTALPVVGPSPALRATSPTGRGEESLTPEQIKFYPLFQQEFERARQEVDAAMNADVVVPVPKDPGGGYTHEQHKRNYKLIYEAGQLYRITKQRAYADYIRRVLLKYAELCPRLGPHPAAANEAAGRLFWQSLNDSVWLVYSVQGYDAIRDTLSNADRSTIDKQVFRVMATFLSDGSPQVFDRIHNHATWANAAVGLTGYTLRDRDLVDKALLGLDKSGRAGFLRQLDLLFSPDGYYAEGPYYQRYALLPFVIFAQAIEARQPERKIFAYRDGIVLKAIRTTIQLTHDGFFFPLNDAMPDKSLKTDELYQAVATAYQVTNDPTLLSIAQWQGRVVLAPEGLNVAKDVAMGKAKPFKFSSLLLRDGPQGDQGALAILRAPESNPEQVLVMKNTAQGMGHGHFDKLSWILYDGGNAIVTDYGAARFLNIPTKAGGRYLPENESWAKQTIAHNTLVVNESSHFNGKLKAAEQAAPKQLFFAATGDTRLSTAEMIGAYPDVTFRRTLAQLVIKDFEAPLIVDVLRVTGRAPAQYDLPLHYQGHLIDVGFKVQSNVTMRPVLGSANGYQHLWVDATGTPSGANNYVTWLNDGRFYTYRVAPPAGAQMIFAQIGANDPNFNLRREPVLIQRVSAASNATFVSLLEPHGKHDGASETTVASESRVRSLRHERVGDVELVHIELPQGENVILAIADDTAAAAPHNVKAAGRDLKWLGHYGRFDQ